jgi:glycerol-3-phosphate dehydrogenase
MTETKPTDRAALIARLAEESSWDVAVIGGGASGLGIALDAASRGLRTVLFEARDFGSGASSRSGQVFSGSLDTLRRPAEWGTLTRALSERGLFLKNAPSLARAADMVLPCRSRSEELSGFAALSAYSAMGGGMGAPRMLSKDAAIVSLPGLSGEGLAGGVSFKEAVFDDAAACTALAKTAAAKGALLLSRMSAVQFDYRSGTVRSVTVRDELSGKTCEVSATCFVLAAGAGTDALRRLIDPEAAPLVKSARSAYAVVSRECMPSATGMLIGVAADGRTLYALPWHGHVLLGTAAGQAAGDEPSEAATDTEIEQLLAAGARFLEKAPQRRDVMASFAADVPAETVACEFGNVIVDAGGWTLYRERAEKALLEATLRHLVPARLGNTKELALDTRAEGRRARAEADALAPGKEEAFLRFVQYTRDFELALDADDVLRRRTRVALIDPARAEALRPMAEAVLEGAAPEEAAAAAAPQQPAA